MQKDGTVGGSHRQPVSSSGDNLKGTYRVVFTGVLLPGRNPDGVERNILKRFKNGDRLIRLIVDGRVSVLKKNADYQTAWRLKQIGEECGIELKIQPETPGTAGQVAPAGPPKSERKAVSAEMRTCPWCGHWQPASPYCAKCRKQLSAKTAGSVAATAVKWPSNPDAQQKPRKTFAAKFEHFRIAVLLCILLIVGLATWMSQRSIAGWKRPLNVVIYPINGDGIGEISEFIAGLEEDDFNVVEKFFAQEAESYGISLPTPVVVLLAPEVKDQPPAPPTSRSRLSIMWWSLKLRYWAFVSDNYAGAPPDIRVFTIYHNATENRILEDSLGIEKSRTGIVHAFADRKMADENKIVLAHELMHTLGATDKYDPRTLKPAFPDGFGDPDLKPLYPQSHAEIMGGRVPLTDQLWEMPRSLDFVVVGEKTAREIRWTRPS